MNEISDLQAQIVALRLAVEGTWLSLLRSSSDPLRDAERMQRANVDTVAQLDATTPEATAMRDAVRHHTERLWGSIVWQVTQD